VARVVVEAGGSRREHPVPKDVPLIIGRSADVNLPVADGKLSREHCKILFDGKFYVLDDLGSKNGTHLNNRKLKSTTPLRSGDEIRIGNTLLKFELEFGDAVPPAEDSVDARIAFQKTPTVRREIPAGSGGGGRLLGWLFLLAVLAGGAYGMKFVFVWALKVIAP
jgi:pSer/pThr/pTyr-binding forkhead associated (FHA) protein